MDYMCRVQGSDWLCDRQRLCRYNYGQQHKDLSRNHRNQSRNYHLQIKIALKVF
jgi:hypothetical protein